MLKPHTELRRRRNKLSWWPCPASCKVEQMNIVLHFGELAQCACIQELWLVTKIWGWGWTLFMQSWWQWTVGKGLEHLQRCSVCDPGKIFFTSKFSTLLQSTHKTETGTANRWGTPNSKPPERIITMGHSEKHWAGVRSYLLQSFHRPRQRAQLCGAKTIFLR